MIARDTLAQTAAEALADDEALRDDLSDAGFTPLLDWASALAKASAAVWLAQPDPRAAMWQGIGALKEIIRGVVASAEALAPEPLLGVAGPLADAVAEALDRVDWSDDPDANAAAIVAAISPLAWQRVLATGAA